VTIAAQRIAHLCFRHALVPLFDEGHKLPDVVEILTTRNTAGLAVLVFHLAAHLQDTKISFKTLH
jgi:hypothetical protein